MCGIAGFIRSGPLGEDAKRVLGAMTDAIAHRGPDADGAWIDTQAGAALGHRRLSIIDLTPTGAQPMVSVDGRWVLAFNGEIYNYRELRARLEGEGNAPPWRGTSDTEVLLAAMVAWGLERALVASKGMFALALWDRQDRRLTLARDRMGEKPLYYGWQGPGADRFFLFGSDAASLAQHPAFDAESNREAVALLTRYLYIPEPWSAWKSVAKLPPGAIATVDPGDGSVQVHRWWDAVDAIATARANPFSGSADEAVGRLETVLGDAVERQMVADVPLGAFLSGGVDSSAVAALMQARSSRPVKTYTIGFEEEDYSEARHARAVAAHLGADHTELIVSASDALALIPELSSAFSEPFADSSQIPTMLVSRLARKHVTVALSGDGGDELFGGYNRYLYAQRYWDRLRRVPRPFRRAVSRAIIALSPERLDTLTGPFLRGRMANAGDKLHKAAGVLDATTPDQLYDRLVSINVDAAALMRPAVAAEPPNDPRLDSLEGVDPVERMMAADTIGYLPGDILVKVDRAAMATSLEGRIPMLDPDVFSFAWSLPLDYRIRGGVTKWPLRQVLYRHVPQALIDRPKMGFSVPIGDWLRGPLREWAESLLSKGAIDASGFYDFAAVQKMWRVHLSGARNLQHQLWPVLMAQAWRA